MRIALATCDDPPVPDRDAERLAPEVEPLGGRAELVSWSDAEVDWTGYDRVMLSSTWDYHTRVDDFRAWLRGLGDAGVPVDNPPGLVEWNLDKRYLRALAVAGVPMIPTVWGGPDGAGRTAEEVDARGWGDVIVKPAVDLGAANLTRTGPDGVRAAAEAIGGVHLAQPFLPSLERDGELSVVLLDGEVTHALRKRPAAGDFRVQPQFGGSHEATTAPAAALEVVASAMGTLTTAPLYARVDLVRDLDERWCCIELELIEPVLYLDVSDGAARRLAALLVGREH